MKKTFYIKFFFFLLLFIRVYPYLPAQNLQKIDSLQNLLKITAEDTAKVPILIKLVLLNQDNSIDMALELAQQALQISKKNNNKKSNGELHILLGNLYFQKGNFNLAKSYYLIALQINKDISNEAGIASGYHNIGRVYREQKNYKEALNYCLQSFEINQKLKLKPAIFNNYNELGLIATEQEKYNEAIQHYQKALDLQGDVEKKYIIGIYGNLSKLYYYMNKLDSAIENAKKVIKEAHEMDNKNYLLSAYSNLGAFYIAAENYSKADSSLQKALKYANELHDKKRIKSIYSNYVQLYANQDDLKKAYEYAQLVLTYKEIMFKENNTRQANELLAKYESDQNESIINSLQKDNALSEEQLKQERNFKIYLSAFGVLIAGFVFVLYRRISQKRKINKVLSEAYIQIEEKNQSITDSINYSKRIQEAILPSKQVINKLFQEIFILFLPKDIVSGDFYWCAEKNGKKLIACCDCTGHGVPGALMSMIGNNILNQIVNENEITSPDEILNQLHIGIRKALKQESQHVSKDGMDIALCSLSPNPSSSGEENWIVDYAGANRPLWIINKSPLPGVYPDKGGREGQREEFTEIKPDKFSIGGYQSESERKFAKHSITLSKGDCIYMFSDGYADQFGGKEGKKFMSKHLKELVISNYSRQMAEQGRNLSETIIHWKGNMEQVDDILVIGIRI